MSIRISQCLELSVPNIKALVARAPHTLLKPNSLECAASWSTEDSRPVTLGEFLVAHFPRTADEFMIPNSLRNAVSVDQKRAPIRRVQELTDDDIRNVTLARIFQGATIITTAPGLGSQEEVLGRTITGLMYYDPESFRLARETAERLLFEELMFEAGKNHPHYTEQLRRLLTV
jgi:hypothetical protein